MKILSNITGVTSLSNVQIQKSCSGILIVKTGSTSAITNETASIALQIGANQNTIATKIKVRELGVITQYGRGYIHQTVETGGNIKTEIFIDLSGRDSAMLLQDNNYVALDLSNLQSSATYQVYALEMPQVEQTYLNYNSQSISGSNSQTKTFSLNPSHQGLYISNNSSLEKLRLFTHDGKECSYDTVELGAIAREVNDITQMSDILAEGDTLNQTIAGGATELFFIPTADFKGFEITTVGGIDLNMILTELKSY